MKTKLLYLFVLNLFLYFDALLYNIFWLAVKSIYFVTDNYYISLLLMYLIYVYKLIKYVTLTIAYGY